MCNTPVLRSDVLSVRDSTEAKGNKMITRISARTVAITGIITTILGSFAAEAIVIYLTTK